MAEDIDMQGRYHHEEKYEEEGDIDEISESARKEHQRRRNKRGPHGLHPRTREQRERRKTNKQEEEQHPGDVERRNTWGPYGLNPRTLEQKVRRKQQQQQQQAVQSPPPENNGARMRASEEGRGDEENEGGEEESDEFDVMKVVALRAQEAPQEETGNVAITLNTTEDRNRHAPPNLEEVSREPEYAVPSEALVTATTTFNTAGDENRSAPPTLGEVSREPEFTVPSQALVTAELVIDDNSNRNGNHDGEDVPFIDDMPMAQVVPPEPKPDPGNRLLCGVVVAILLAGAAIAMAVGVTLGKYGGGAGEEKTMKNASPITSIPPSASHTTPFAPTEPAPNHNIFASNHSTHPSENVNATMNKTGIYTLMDNTNSPSVSQSGATSICSDEHSSYGGSQFYPKAQSFVAPANRLLGARLYMENPTNSPWKVRIIRELPLVVTRGTVNGADLYSKTLGEGTSDASEAGWVEIGFDDEVLVELGETYYLYLGSYEDVFGTNVSAGNWMASPGGAFPGPYSEGTGWIMVYDWSDNSNNQNTNEEHRDYAFCILFDGPSGSPREDVTSPPSNFPYVSPSTTPSTYPSGSSGTTLSKDPTSSPSNFPSASPSQSPSSFPSGSSDTALSKDPTSSPSKPLSASPSYSPSAAHRGSSSTPEPTGTTPSPGPTGTAFTPGPTATTFTPGPTPGFNSICSDDHSSYGGSQFYPKAQSFVAPANRLLGAKLYMKNPANSPWKVRIIRELPLVVTRGTVNGADLDSKTLGEGTSDASEAGWIEVGFDNEVLVESGETYYLYLGSYEGVFGGVSAANWMASPGGAFPGPYSEGTGWIMVYDWNDNSNYKEHLLKHRDYAFCILFHEDYHP